MDENLALIAAKKERLDAIRPVSRAAILALQKSYDVDLTYTSNAIEGNTLTLREDGGTDRTRHHRGRQAFARSS